MKVLKLLPLLVGIILMSLIVTACGPRPAVVQTRVQVEKVPVPARCPDRASYEALKKDRPRPLRERAMPASPEERVAQTAAQLGRFEAKGGWADRAEAILDRCQEGLDLP